ncbi:methyltransferase domain-containing protein [Nocardia sp. NPDC088792]|uniref:methyltransferase domain-containing protein n=1 Tax=Nocardia sp. NPDC088792 TaxID=3364332 RepID=UPI0037F5434C
MWPADLSVPTSKLDVEAVVAHPWCGPAETHPRQYRGPHQLSRDGWTNFTERLERGEEISLVRALAAGRAHALDMGGGTGELTAAVAAHAGRCVAVEPHRDRVAVLDEMATGSAVEVHPGQAEALPFADRTFDFVLAAWVLPYAQDLQGALHEIARVCDNEDPDAAIVIIGGAPDNELVRLLNDVGIPVAGEEPDHQGFLLAEAARVFAEHGFSEFSLLRTESALHFRETSQYDRIAAAATTLADFWFEGHPRSAEIRRALEPALSEHFAHRPHAIGDQATVLVARPAGMARTRAGSLL